MEIKFNHPAPGLIIALGDKSYQIMAHHIEWTNSDVTTMTDLREVNDEGDFIDEWDAQVNLDFYDYKVF